MRQAWDGERIHQEILDWLVAPSNQYFIRDRSLALIRAFLDGGIDPDTGLAVETVGLFMSLDNLSIWYASEGVALLFEGDTAGLDRLALACRCDALSIRASIQHHTHLAREERAPLLRGNEISLRLARAITLGHFAIADDIAQQVWRGVEESAFCDTDSSPLPDLVLSIYRQWRGLTPVTADAGLRRSGLYRSVLARWQDADPSALGKALSAACDFHVARSREHSDWATYEFADEVYRLHPVEILFMLRLREQLGLALPVLTHKLMQTPCGRLYPPRPIPNDALLDRLADQVQNAPIE